MNAHVLPISQVRSQLPNLVQDADTLVRKTYITVKGQIKAAIVNAKELELLESTLEVLNDPKTMDAIKKGKAEVKQGKLVDWENLKQELGL